MELNYVPIIWLALGIAFAVAEGLTVQLVSIWFAIGAAVTALVTALIDIPWPTQLLIIVIVAGVLLVATRPLAKKLLFVKKQSTNADSVIGQVGVVLQAIDNDLATGRVKVNGLDWSARSSNADAIAENTRVRVLAIDGVKLIVERCE